MLERGLKKYILNLSKFFLPISKRKKSDNISILKGYIMKSFLSVFMFVFVLMCIGCTIQFAPPSDYPDYPPVTYPDDYQPPMPPEETPPPIPQQEYPAVQKNTNFDARIDAAKAITNFSTRDGALSAIAIDAANELDVEHTIKALNMITNFSTRDNTAERCVAPFINRDMVEEAKNIANRITNFSIRDRTLARIAQGPAR